MNCRLFIFLGLAWTLVHCEEVCETSDYEKYMSNYMNRVAGTIKGITDEIFVKKFKFLEESNDNMTKAFKKAGCPELWESKFTLADRDTKLYQLMEGLDPKPDQAAIDLIQQLEGVIWHLAQDNILATCMISVTRSYLLEQVSKCAGEGKVPFEEKKLGDVTIPHFAGKEEFEKNVRAAITRMAWALMRAQKCGEGKDAIQTALNQITKANDENFCYGVYDSFDSDACYDQFVDNCPSIIDCTLKVTKDLQHHAVKLFVKSAKRFKSCLQASTEHWAKNGRPEGMASTSSIIADSLKYWKKISDIELSEEVKERSKHYFNAIALTIVRPHTCHCEIPVPMADSEESEEEKK